MSIFSLEPLAARHGDCLLLHYGDPDAPRTMLIDGGPAKVWRQTLKPRLDRLAKARPGPSFAIDLLLVSHIDDDHVVGLVDMMEEWRDAATDRRSWPFPVEAMWHNSFERVAGGDPAALRASVLASIAGTLAAREDGEHDREETRCAAKVLASVAKGAQLRRDADLLRVPVNVGFDDGLVLPGGTMKLDGGLEVVVVGPLSGQIEALRAKFAEDLPKGGEAALAAYLDDSVPNLSSIVVLARAASGTMLLTGDARGDLVLQGLESAGLLDGGRLHVDVLKMPHHGSERNVERDFFERVTADVYVASANGQYENPDRGAFELLAAARGADSRFVIRLTYEVDQIDDLRRGERAKSRETAVRRGWRRVPEEWDHERHSLEAFFARCHAEGFRFRVETPSTATSACVDLGDAVSF